MALIPSLVEVTPYRLRYLIIQDEDIDPPTAVSTVQIPNAFGASPDLRTDSFTAFGRSPIFNLFAFTPVPTDIQAMVRVCGDGSPTGGSVFVHGDNVLLERPRAHIYITPRQCTVGTVAWAVRPRAGAAASANFSVLEIQGPSALFDAAYLDIDFEHSIHR